MNRAMFSIILLALRVDTSIAEIVNETMTPQDFDVLYQAAVDISMTCYGDPGNAIGIIGDTDGSILKELRLNHFIPVVLVNGSKNDHWGSVRSRKLQVFVVAVRSSQHLQDLLFDLYNYIWWNEGANFLIVDTRFELQMQCTRIEYYMLVTTWFGMLNVQFICRYRQEEDDAIMIWNSNPFTHRAPNVWKFFREYNFQIINKTVDKPNSCLFMRLYGGRGQSCESINFAKTGNVGGYPLRFISDLPPFYLNRHSNTANIFTELSRNPREILSKWTIDEHRWFIDNIVIAMNVSAVMTDVVPSVDPGILLQPQFFSTRPQFLPHASAIILRLNQVPILAVSQHTRHMSQLDKILSVIDKPSRIGMWVVYLITFLFFKFFLGQAVTPAILNLVRLTCGTGLQKLPQNVAPTLYLTSLFMFVVTFQAIYTGNLATLLTSTISYPNVQRREDIRKLGYKIYIKRDFHIKPIADPILDGCVIEIPDSEECIDYVLRDPLAVCAMDHTHAISAAADSKLHLSKDPILTDYIVHITTSPNMLQRRLQEVFMMLFEAGLYLSAAALEKLRLEFVDDDDVKKNTERRVMTFEDLRFAFVILGVGLLCSFICFIGEIVICRIHLKIAKRRNRIRVRSAWAVTAKPYSWFPSLNCRFNLRHLFSNRR